MNCKIKEEKKKDNKEKEEKDFYYSQILKCKTERERFKNLEFNGKNIITKNIITKENKKSNGSLPNLELLKEIYDPNTVSNNTNSANNTIKNKTNVLNSDKKKKREINLKTNNLIDNKRFNVRMCMFYYLFLFFSISDVSCRYGSSKFF